MTVTQLYTTGYEQHATPHSLVEALQEAGVQRLVDVRELPLSRRRGFSKTALGEVLEQAGIEYVHEKALGNPKPLRDQYKSGDVEGGSRGYRAHVRNGSSWAVDELGESLAGAGVTCLMCVEHDHQVCHRDVLVAELHRRLPGKLDVVHL